MLAGVVETLVVAALDGKSRQWAPCAAPERAPRRHDGARQGSGAGPLPVGTAAWNAVRGRDRRRPRDRPRPDARMLRSQGTPPTAP